VFVANTDTYEAVRNFNLPHIPRLAKETKLALDFSTAERVHILDEIARNRGYGHKILELGPGEGRVYRVVHPQPDNA
jgi:hypothetical protein